MKTQRERAEEKRVERLADIDRQVRSGTLVVRQMTDEERRRFPPRDRRADADRRSSRR